MNKKQVFKRLSSFFTALVILVYVCAIPSTPVLAAYYNDTFDLDKAQSYAKKWYKSRNLEEYVDQGTNSDCANFVSQILIAGGIPENQYFHASKKYSSSQTPSTYNAPSLIQYFRSMYGVAYYSKALNYINNYSLSVGSISDSEYINKYKNNSGNYNNEKTNMCDGHSFSISDIKPGDCVTINGANPPNGRGHIVYVLSVNYSTGAVYVAGHSNSAYADDNGKYFISATGSATDINGIMGVLKTSDLVASSVSPEISITGASSSGTIYSGEYFKVSGIISSGLPLTSVKINFYDATNKSIEDYEWNPQKKSFSFADELIGVRLPVGVHKFTITASNAEKKNVVLYEKIFAVLSNEKTIANGTYKISYSGNSTYLMGAAGTKDADNVNLYVDSTQSGKPKNIWYISYVDNGYYIIRNFESGYYLDVANGGTKDTTNVLQASLHYGDNQQWQILSAGGGTYCLVPKHATGSCADVNGGNNSNIEICSFNLGANQRFVFTETDGFSTSGNKITFNANGGTIPSAYASYAVNGVNKDIGNGELIIYNTPGQIVRTPDTNYIMARVGSDGRVWGYSKYKSGDEETIPQGGFVIIGKRGSGASFLEQVELADYIGYNRSTKIAYVYKNKNAYLANHKYVESGYTYGDLPTPIYAGYDFGGWYTAKSGGTKITSGSAYSTNTLYAHWGTASGVAIDSTSFPDANFRAYISEEVDKDKSGRLSQEELEDVMSMQLSNKGIQDLTGIEYFPLLTMLYCQGNSLTSLDISKNKYLGMLNCSDNNLTSLDLSQNTRLMVLTCYGNNLVHVNISNTGVADTSFFCTTDNKGTAGTENNYNIGTVKDSYSLSNLTQYGFDSSKASNWKGATYNKSSNTLTNFTSTKISYDYDCGNGLTATFYLTAVIDKNVVQITTSTFPDANFRSYVSEEVDADKDGWLSENEINKISGMQVSNRGIKDLTGIEYFTSVERIYCQNNSLTSLDLSKNKELMLLNCSNNNLTSLDLSKNTNLTLFTCYNNNLVHLNLSNTQVDEESFITFNDPDNEEKENRFNIGEVNNSYSLSNLTKYGFVSSKASNWKGATYNASSNSLTDFQSTKVSYDYDCGNGFKVTLYLVADSIPSSPVLDINSANFPDSVFRNFVLKNIDKDGDSKLSQVEIEKTTSIVLDRDPNNGAKNLVGIENFTELIELDCSYNSLTSLDVSKNTKLQRLFCGSNQLSSLNVAKNTDLTYLDCMENNLTTLNVSQNSKLSTLDCSDNKISSLNLTSNKELVVLYCYLNELTTLDLSQNIKLQTLKANSNNLTNLDLNNTQVTNATISNNRFEIGRESSYNLSNLTSYGFNLAKASNWQGAVLTSNTLDCISGSNVTFDYDCGNGITETFTLYRDPLTVKDSATSITVSNSSGLGDNMQFSASVNQLSMDLGKGLTQIKAYDTNFINYNSDGGFSGKAIISIPAPTGYDTSKLKVLHKEADGTFKDMKAVYNSGTNTLVFESDEFGTYVVALADDVLKGDLNGDGEVNSRDLILLRAYISQNTDEYNPAADINDDGEVNSRDLILLRSLISQK